MVFVLVDQQDSSLGMYLSTQVHNNCLVVGHHTDNGFIACTDTTDIIIIAKVGQ